MRIDVHRTWKGQSHFGLCNESLYANNGNESLHVHNGDVVENLAVTLPALMEQLPLLCITQRLGGGSAHNKAE